LESVRMSDGEPINYKITFFGQVKNVFDRFGDDTLPSIYSKKFWDTDSDDTLNNVPQNSTVDHNYTADNVKSGITNPNFLSGNLFYPLISQQRLWRIGTGNDPQPGSDPAIVMDILTDAGAIKFLELKPAVKMRFLISRIEDYYKISFGQVGFFNRALFQNMFMWLSNSSSYMSSYGDKTKVNLVNSTLPPIYGESQIFGDADKEYIVSFIKANEGSSTFYSSTSVVDGYPTDKPKLAYDDSNAAPWWFWLFKVVSGGIEVVYRYDKEKLYSDLSFVSGAVVVPPVEEEEPPVVVDPTDPPVVTPPSSSELLLAITACLEEIKGIREEIQKRNDWEISRKV